MQSFLDILLSNNEFSPEQIDKIRQIIRTKSIAKGQMLLRKGELIMQGPVRAILANPPLWTDEDLR